MSILVCKAMCIRIQVDRLSAATFEMSIESTRPAPQVTDTVKASLFILLFFFRGVFDSLALRDGVDA